MSTTVVFDKPYAPKVTLTLHDDGAYTAVLEVDGLEPKRSVSREEFGSEVSTDLGSPPRSPTGTDSILSLDPPTVFASQKATPRLTHRRLIDLAQRAVVSSVESTTGGDVGGIGGMLMSYYRVAKGVRHALRMIDPESI